MISEPPIFVFRFFGMVWGEWVGVGERDIYNGIG
jgi:hypothetical protein